MDNEAPQKVRRLAESMPVIRLDELKGKDLLGERGDKYRIEWQSSTDLGVRADTRITFSDEVDRHKLMLVDVHSSVHPAYSFACQVKRRQYGYRRQHSRWFAVPCPGDGCDREPMTIYLDIEAGAAGCWVCLGLTYLSRRKQNKRLDAAKKDLEGWLKKRAAMPKADPVVTARITIQALAWRRQRGLD